MTLLWHLPRRIAPVGNRKKVRCGRTAIAARRAVSAGRVTLRPRFAIGLAADIMPHAKNYCSFLGIYDPVDRTVKPLPGQTVAALGGSHERRSPNQFGGAASPSLAGCQDQPPAGAAVCAGNPDPDA